MDEQELREQFVRFRDERDAGALAKVFDSLAPGLLKLARHLTRDRVLAEDLLQATFLTAMEKASIFDDTRPLRPWLNGILFLHARQMQRSSSPIPDDARLAQPEVRDPSEIVSSRELEEEVDRALRSLPERYKQVLIPRFRLGLRGTEIARDMGRSPGVVRMQIHRGLELLKRALPQSLLTLFFGFLWSRWALASVRANVLAGAAAPAAVSQGSTLLMGGALVMKKVILATACTALLVGASILVLQGDGDQILEVETTGPERADKGVDISLDGTERVPGDGEKQPIPLHAGPSLPSESSGPAQCTGRILDPRGTPLVGSRLYFEGMEEEAVVSDAQGHFVFSNWYSDSQLLVAAPYILVRAGRDVEQKGRLLVAALRVNVDGVVTDRDGIPLPDTRVTLKPIRLVDFPEILDGTRQILPVGTQKKSGAQGRFSLRDVPGDCALLELEKEGYETLTVPVDLDLAGDQAFVLRPLASDRVILTGRVLDHHSCTVAQALVGLVDYRTRTDDWGLFRIEIHREEIPREGANLFAAKRGYRTKVVAGFGARPDILEPQVDIELCLEGPALAISGRLLDSGGRPVAGSTMMLWEEEYLFGRAAPEDLAAVDEQAAILDGRPLTVPAETRAFSITDSDGVFAIGGLDDRAYRFRIFDDQIGYAMTTRSIRAGSRDVEIVIPADAFREKLAGRIVDRHGAPVAGAEIRACMQRIHNSNNNSWIGVGSARCDDDGRFVIPGACRLDTLLLDVSGPSVCSLQKQIEPDFSGGEITLVVERLCHFRIELSDPSLARSFHLLDEKEELLEISEQGGLRVFKKTPFPLLGGKTEVISSSDRACTIKLNGEEERRFPVRLVPGEVTVLRF